MEFFAAWLVFMMFLAILAGFRLGKLFGVLLVAAFVVVLLLGMWAGYSFDDAWYPAIFVAVSGLIAGGLGLFVRGRLERSAPGQVAAPTCTTKRGRASTDHDVPVRDFYLLRTGEEVTQAGLNTRLEALVAAAQLDPEHCNRPPWDVINELTSQPDLNGRQLVYTGKKY